MPFWWLRTAQIWHWGGDNAKFVPFPPHPRPLTRQNRKSHIKEALTARQPMSRFSEAAIEPKRGCVGSFGVELLLIPVLCVGDILAYP
jgi:hypothetical protein